MPGREFLEAIRDGELPAAPIQDLMGFQPGGGGGGPRGLPRRARASSTTTRSAWSTAAWPPRCSTARWAPRCTARSRSAPATRRSRPSSTWCAPITADSGSILAEGRVVHRGSRVATAEGRIVREADGKLLAHGTSTCLVLAAEAAPSGGGLRGPAPSTCMEALDELARRAARAADRARARGRGGGGARGARSGEVVEAEAGLAARGGPRGAARADAAARHRARAARAAAGRPGAWTR